MKTLTVIYLALFGLLFTSNSAFCASEEFVFRNNAEEYIIFSHQDLKLELKKESPRHGYIYHRLSDYFAGIAAYLNNGGNIIRFNTNDDTINKALDFIAPTGGYERSEITQQFRASMRTYKGKVRFAKKFPASDRVEEDYYLIELSENGENPAAPYDTRPMVIDPINGYITWNAGMGNEKVGPSYAHIQLCNKRSGLVLIDEMGLRKSQAEKERIYKLLSSKTDSGEEVAIIAYDNGHPLSGKCLKEIL